MKKKGFTLVELLVVIAIIALLMSILMPALAQVRRLAQRMMCGTNLKGLGNAIITYADDNQERVPRAGRQRSKWGEKLLPASRWAEKALREVWTDAEVLAGTNNATIGSCWYLLIKYADVTPKQFICGGDQGAIPFKLSDHLPTSLQRTLTEVWDFGDATPPTTHDSCPGVHYSYSYQYPFNHNYGGSNVGYPLTSSSNPASPLAADRNPYLCNNAKSYAVARDATQYRSPTWNESTRSYIDSDKVSNAAMHQKEGQNVLYLDAHVEWEKQPNSGVENDNIWLPWPTGSTLTLRDKQFSTAENATPLIAASVIGKQTIGPRDPTDAFLVNEYNVKP